MTRLVIKSIKLKHKEVYFYSPEALSLGGYNASLEVLANLKLHNTHKHNNINTERDSNVRKHTKFKNYKTHEHKTERF